MYNEWSLDVFYKGIDDPALTADMADLEATAAEYKSAVAALNYDDVAASLRKIIDMKEKLTLLVRRLAGYFSLRRSANSKDSEVSGPQTKVQTLMAGLAKENTMFEAYVGKIFSRIIDKKKNRA